MINFALGEWVMVAAMLVATGLQATGLGLAGALGLAALGMVALGLAVSRTILRPLVGQPLISFIMVTLGLGALLRGASADGLPGHLSQGSRFPLPSDPVAVYGVLISTGKLAAALIAAVAIVAVSWFFRRSRTGLALQAIADDQQAAMGVGIDLDRHFAMTWAIMGALCVLGGTLWTFVSGGGLGIVLVGLKVFPIVIIGGLDSIPGTIVGAVALGMLEAWPPATSIRSWAAGSAASPPTWCSSPCSSPGRTACSGGRTSRACRRRPSRACFRRLWYHLRLTAPAEVGTADSVADGAPPEGHPARGARAGGRAIRLRGRPRSDRERSRGPRARDGNRAGGRVARRDSAAPAPPGGGGPASPSLCLLAGAGPPATLATLYRLAFRQFYYRPRLARISCPCRPPRPGRSPWAPCGISGSTGTPWWACSTSSGPSW